MGFLYFLLITAISIFLIWVEWKIATEFYEIAKEKGHSERKYFWYCFFLTFVGYILVIALQNKSTTSNEEFKLPEL